MEWLRLVYLLGMKEGKEGRGEKEKKSEQRRLMLSITSFDSVGDSVVALQLSHVKILAVRIDFSIRISTFTLRSDPTWP